MVIAPNSGLRILSNVPLDNTYVHTIYFASVSSQISYFTSKLKFANTQYTYIRTSTNVIRVNQNPEALYDCNYIMFQNTSFGNKWFYAFITDTVYVNNECTELHFEIDVMQTWFFETQVLKSFVERQHSYSDAIGSNITPEPIQVNEYVYQEYEPVQNMNYYRVLIAIVDTSGETDGTLYDGIYGSAKLFCYDSTDVQGINEKVNEYVQKPDAIIGMYMCPTILIPYIPETHQLTYGASGLKTIVAFGSVNAGTKLDGYTPNNKKLLTYPFNFFHVDNASGQSLALRYEFFEDNMPRVEISGNITQPVQCVLRPVAYKGTEPGGGLATGDTLNTESISLQNFPICSWNVDAYQAWVAQNSVPLVLNTVSSAMPMTINAGIAEGLGATGTGVMSGIGIISNLLSQVYTASIQADISKGQLNNGSPNVSAGKQQFYKARACIPYQLAVQIDGFFDLYGYAVKSVATVNRNVRPHWCYTKTVGVNLKGNVPAPDMNKIAQCYNNGITFWMNGDEIGNYDLDNRVR